MTPERFRQIRNLFEAALERDAAARSSFLVEACQGDEPLCAEVGRLLAAHLQEAAPLDREAVRPELLTGEPGRMEGRRIDRYEILRELGRGGMGAVYLALRTDDVYRKSVAFKVVRAEAGTQEVIQRFRREREILASLDHPNLARLLDGGTTPEGLPYFVMDYVEGQPIDTYCDERQLNVEERLKLFRTVAAAVAYAHGRGVVHRDLKPGNILVTAEGVVKLLDFGIAKLLRAEAAETAAPITLTGMRLMTPEYASPEQVRGEAVGTASDIYSLGVILYELLTGHRPYRMRSRLIHEVVRVICEEEPTQPSTAVTEVEQRQGGDDDKAVAVTPESVSRARAATPRGLRRRLSGDPDKIILKALRKDPAQRYPSAEAFGEDVRRHLEGLPVLARRQGALLKMARYTWRRRITVGAAAIGAILVLAVVGALVRRVRHQTEIERVRWTLQQVINNPHMEPLRSQPDWSHLQSILHQEVRQNPNGDLALLAQRAACRVTVDAPSFGLVSELPELGLSVNPGVDPGKAFLNVVYVEGALDDGPWEPIGSAAYQEKDESSGFLERSTLDNFFPRAKLTPTPHEIKLRATFRFFDPGKLSAEAQNEISKSRSAFVENAWPWAQNAALLFTETRELDTISINLFTEYPKDFPRAASATEGMGPPQSWFHLDRVRIVRVSLPAGNATGFALEWPHDKEKRSYCSPGNPADLTNRVIGIEFLGRMEPPIPLAADGTVWSDRDSKPLLSFPIVLGELGQLYSVGNASIGANAVLIGSRDVWLSNMADFAAEDHPSLKTLPEGTKDGITSGHIDFVPSRSVALATKSLDRYFGEKLSIPVSSLEVITVPGEWIQKKGCH